RRNRDLVVIVITDQNDQQIFSPSRTHAPDVDAVTPLGQRFANLKVRAGIRPEYAGSLVVGGLPSSRLPFMFGLLALAAALTIVAVTQLRREAELSGMRANWISSVSHELRTPLAQI